VVRNLLAIEGNVALVGPRFFACEQSREFFGVSAPSSYRAKWSAFWRARVERRFIRFSARMAGRFRAARMQSAEQIQCKSGKELQPDLAGLDELGNVLPKKRVSWRQISKPQPGLPRNINF